MERTEKNTIWKVLLGGLLLILCAVMVFTAGKTVAKAEASKEIVLNMSAGDPYKIIQEALNEARDNATDEMPYKIVIPAGTYDLNGQLKVYSNTWVSMNGVTLRNKYGKTMMRFGWPDDEFSAYNGYRNITFEGGTWDGLNKAAALFHFSHSENIVIKNATFKNVKSSHHVEFAACRDVLVENCRFYNYTGKTSSNNEALQMDVVHNKEHYSDGKYDDTPCQNVTVTGCTFQNVQRGVGTHTGVAGSYFSNIQITDNVFDNIHGYAIIGTNFINSKIDGNVITNAAAGIMFRSMIQSQDNFYAPNKGSFVIDRNSNSSITNNKITVTNRKYSATSYGISVYGEKRTKVKNGIPKGDFRIAKVTVSGNTVYLKDSGYGIWFQGTMNSKITNNNIVCATPKSGDGKGNGDGVRLVKSTKNTILGNRITVKNKNSKCKNACGIVLTNGSSATITQNILKKANKDSIFVTQKSTAAIKKNTIQGAGRYGVHASEKSKVTASGNKIKLIKKKYQYRTSLKGKVNGKTRGS